MGRNEDFFSEDIRRDGCPYDDLYIYLINGVIDKRDRTVFGNDLLGNWVEEGTSFLFFSEPADGAVAKLLRLRPDLELLDHYYFRYEEWQECPRQPLRTGGFLIKPPWMNVTCGHEETRIILDPGLVFGNGSHPTTADCLRALRVAAGDRPFMTVLDLGTGTGLLGIAAGLLGATRVIAVDRNPLCVETAMRNIRLNGLEGLMDGVEDGAENYVKHAADLVIANIGYDVIVDFVNKRVFAFKERVILSGLMRSQVPEVRRGLEKRGLVIRREWDYDMTWFTLLAEKS